MTTPPTTTLIDEPRIAADPIARELAIVASAPTGTSSAGHPYLSDEAFARFRDRVPHILAMGPVAWRALDVVAEVAKAHGVDVTAAVKVLRTCISTAAVTAPPDLWLLRHVGGNLAKLGITQLLLNGERIDAAACVVDDAALDARELDADLTLLLSRGLVDGDDGCFVAPHSVHAWATLAALSPVPPQWPADVSQLWMLAFAAGRPRSEVLSGVGTRALDDAERRVLIELGSGVRPHVVTEPHATWVPSIDDVEVGFRVVPLVLAMRATNVHARLAAGDSITATSLAPGDADVGAAAIRILEAAGVVDSAGAPTTTGKRVAEKGAGPMGIIEAYHPYMAALDGLVRHGRSRQGRPNDDGGGEGGGGYGAWVTRGANIAASQDANRESFHKANDALDAFVTETGFRYDVFIEHAIGRGEATRQRFERDGDKLRYFGADLEDAAIDACIEEQARGVLPHGMVFVRHADIGDPAPLVRAVRDNGASTEGAVMIVGNGFHEVRGKDDEGMVEVFRAYCDAGFVLLFTEENALRIDDLLATAWNTYHAGFRYVHEKSGQGLRPADPALPSSFGKPLKKSWRECAEKAGYVQVDKYSSKSRTVYPLAPKERANPSISGNHFCVPARLMPSTR